MINGIRRDPTFRDGKRGFVFWAKRVRPFLKTVGLWVVFSALFGCPVVAAETVRMAIFSLEPFLTKAGETEDPGGITIEYWRDYIAPRMGVQLEVLGPFPSKRAENMLENGTVDVVSQLTKLPYREAKFLFPQTHLTEIQSCLVVLPDSPIVSVSKPEQLFGRRIVFMEDAYIPSFLAHKEISFHLIAAEDYRQTFFNMLFARRVDATLDINYVSLVEYLRNHDYTDRTRIVFLPVDPVKVYSIFSNSERGRRLRDAFDAANREGLAEKRFETMVNDYLKANSRPNRTD